MGTSLDFLTNGVVVIADAIKIVQNSKEKINQSTSQKEDDNKESKDLHYDDKYTDLEEEQQEKETGEFSRKAESSTINQIF